MYEECSITHPVHGAKFHDRFVYSLLILRHEGNYVDDHNTWARIPHCAWLPDDPGSHAPWGILAREPMESCTLLRYNVDPGSHAQWGILAIEHGESCALVTYNVDPGSHVQWGILARVPRESCTVRYHG